MRGLVEDVLVEGCGVGVGGGREVPGGGVGGRPVPGLRSGFEFEASRGLRNIMRWPLRVMSGRKWQFTSNS